MPRGQHPNSRANLIKNSDLTPSERKAKASMMGKKSGEARRELKTFKELDAEYTTNEERKKILEVLKKKAMQGNLRAFEIYRDTVGLKPTDKMELSRTDIIIDFGGIDKGDLEAIVDE